MNYHTLNSKMENAMSHYEKELASIRTSRASTSMLDNIMVDAYNSKTPISQLANINVPDPSTLTIQVWDNSLIKNIETAVIESNLGINPQTDGNIIRLPIPKLSEERRLELTKIASQYSENAKISIRNIRRDSIDEFKIAEKEKEISQDDLKKHTSNVQKITDDFTKKIDETVLAKRNEILKV
ncbi:ribosome recycling factor [Alphaproteobacteria bacterium]|nr:ribosome recycling factor [Alphaproteobacteria bacterium]